MAKLSVNINKIATLRNQRPLPYPDPSRYARIALEAGAAGITIHPRPDQRHIRHSDVEEVAEMVSRYPGRELNIEGNPFHHYFPLVEVAQPTQCTLVPDDMNQSTSDHGFDLVGTKDLAPLRDAIARLKTLCDRVSIFMDPDEKQIELAATLGVDRVELYTQPYAEAHDNSDLARVLPRYVKAAETARAAGLGLNAGHDLSLFNLSDLVRAIPWIDEVSIGHALVADALEFGLAETVRMYITAARPT